MKEHSAASTAAGRINCQIEKSHHGDAAATGCPEYLRHFPAQPVVIEAKGRGNRQRILPDKYGTPRGKEFPKYCKLPEHIRKITPIPSHKKRAKRILGVATGDYVRFIHKGKQVQGYGTISHSDVALTKPKWKSIKADHAQVIERNHGYEVAYPA